MNGQNADPPRQSRESHHTRNAHHRPFAHVEEERQQHHKRKAMKNHLIAMSGEFVGTILFLWFAFAGTTVAALTNTTGESNPSQLVFVSLSFGMSLLVVVWAFYRISGGLFNPAVTLGLCISGAVPWMRGLFLLPAQLLAGIIAAALASCMLPGQISVYQTRLSPETSIAQGVFIEMFLTALLVFVILMLAAEKHYATHMAPIGIGLTLFTAELAGVYFTGGSLNPARSFGPDVVAASFPGYHYIYWFGPIMGALLAGGYYRFNKLWNYEEVNPGQDAKSEKET